MNEETQTTPALLNVTPSLPPFTPTPSETPLPPEPQSQPTVNPVEGTTATQLNVRDEPSTASNVLGMIPANTSIQIIGKDPGENWWQILYPQAAEGKGWVTAQYITTTSQPDVPTIGVSKPEVAGGNMAIVQQQLNIRSGPETSFNSLGTLNPQDVVSLTGKDPDGVWLQIDFPAGPNGKGWVNASFVKAQGVENLPIISEAGLIVGTGTPTGIPPTPTATLLPALEDGDSAASPAVNISFSPTGTRALQYSSDVSAPTGDTEDWIQFTPYGRGVLVEISCEGSHMLDIELLQNGQAIQGRSELNCGAQAIVAVEPGKPVQVHVSAIPNGSLDYSSYTLNIKTLP